MVLVKYIGTVKLIFWIVVTIIIANNSMFEVTSELKDPFLNNQ